MSLFVAVFTLSMRWHLNEPGPPIGEGWSKAKGYWPLWSDLYSQKFLWTPETPWKTVINSVKTFTGQFGGAGEGESGSALWPRHIKNVTSCFRAPHEPLNSTWKTFLKTPQSTAKPRSRSLKTGKQSDQVLFIHPTPLCDQTSVQVPIWGRLKDSFPTKLHLGWGTNTPKARWGRP